MNEIPSILEKKENIIWEGKPKYAPYIISGLLGCLLFGIIVGLFVGSFFKTIMGGAIMAIIVSVLTLVIIQLSYQFIHYGLTTRRVILQSGIFGRNFKSVNYDDIKNASVSRGLFNWIFETGSIKIFTGEMESTGGKHSKIRPKYDSLDYIENSYEILKKLQENLTQMEEGLYGGKNVVQNVKIIK
jgi:uncharacterized membrane protein YdbT with pleckstrin-like domain